LLQDLSPGHDEGDPNKRLTRYKLCYIVCSFLFKHVIDYLESETERTHLHVDARHLLVGHVGPLLWMCMLWAVCGTSALVVHGMWMYVDVCGTTELVEHAVWMYVTSALIVHAMWFMWDYCIGFACYVDVCGVAIN
jgi:hypothetical protein